MSTPLALDDTIGALASAPGPGARGVIRISGPDVRDVLDRGIFVADDGAAWRDAVIALRHSGRLQLVPLDIVLPADVYLWPTRRSYTGQQLAELHTIGVPPLLEALLGTLFQNGVRPARPGEFTLRAFLAGRVDLVQAEAVLGVIDAEDHEELELALQQLAGGLSGKIGNVRLELLNLLADLEAGLDFVEEDIEFVAHADLLSRLDDAAKSLSQLRDQSNARIQSTGRLRVVIAGLPNAGKSTLFNALVGSSNALVSDQHGTTRDYLNSHVDLNGLMIELVDTAGWEDVQDSESDADIRSRAQQLRAEQLQRADLVIWTTACDLESKHLETDRLELSIIREQHPTVLHVATKSDLGHDSVFDASTFVSVTENSGLDQLVESMRQKLSDSNQVSRHLIGTTAARCQDSLARAIDSIHGAHSAAEQKIGEELVVVEIRESLDALGEILGTVYTDDILDRIFSKFCIGK